MRIFIIIFITICYTPIFGQTIPPFIDGISLQPWQNKMYYNAAATGFDQKKVITFSGSFLNPFRYEQRLKNLNAIISYEQPYKKSRSSFGFFTNYNVYGNDGYYKYLSGAVSYSYGIPLGKERFLRLGLQAGVKNMIYYYPWRLPSRGYYEINGSTPFINSGLFFNSTTFYGGIAVKSLYEPAIRTENANGNFVDYKTKPYLNVTAGNTFFKNKTVSWNPNILYITNTDGHYIQINNTFIYKQQFAFGASFIKEDVNTVALNTSIDIGEKLVIGGSYYSNLMRRGLNLQFNHGFEVLAKIKL